METSLSARAWSVMVSAFGGLLVLVHLGHAAAEDESVRAIVFGILFPFVVSVGILAGGIWIWRAGFETEETRRTFAWCFVGVLTLGTATVATILYQRSHGVVVADRAFVVINSISFGGLVGVVVGIYDVQRRRQRRSIRRRKRALNELHATTRELVQLSDREAVCSQAVDAARDILDMTINGCWLYDESEEALVPVAWTDEALELMDEQPVYDGGESLSWRAHQTGEILTFDDVHESSRRHNDETVIRSEIILPLGEHGVMNVGSTRPNAFDQSDVSLMRILAANTQTALERADREQEIAAARERTKRLNRQLGVLNRVLRHDIRNAANVIRGNAELLAERADCETEPAATIRAQADELVGLGERARDFERTIRDDDHESATIDIAAVIEAELERIEREYPSVETSEPIPDSCFVTAHPRIEAAIANVVENAAEHNDHQRPRIEVEIDRPGEGRVEVRIADNGPGIPDSEVTVLERGYETPLEHASGLGLWLVSWIVNESGGDIRFEENDPRGSVVRLRFDEADEAH